MQWDHHFVAGDLDGDGRIELLAYASGGPRVTRDAREGRELGLWLSGG